MHLPRPKKGTRTRKFLTILDCRLVDRAQSCVAGLGLIARGSARAATAKKLRGAWGDPGAPYARRSCGNGHLQHRCAPDHADLRRVYTEPARRGRAYTRAAGGTGRPLRIHPAAPACSTAALEPTLRACKTAYDTICCFNNNNTLTQCYLNALSKKPLLPPSFVCLDDCVSANLFFLFFSSCAFTSLSSLPSLSREMRVRTPGQLG